MNRNLVIARWPSVKKTVGQRVALAWPDLITLLSRHDIRPNKTTGPGWSPSAFSVDPPVRKGENVTEVSLLVLDADTAEALAAGFASVRRLGLEAVYHTSHSSTPDLPRGRFVIPLTRPVPAADWKAFWCAANAYLMGGSSDKQCKDPARYYWLPSAPNRDHASCEHFEGCWLDPDSIPRLAPVARPTVARVAAAHTNGNGRVAAEKVVDWVMSRPHGSRHEAAQKTLLQLHHNGYSEMELAGTYDLFMRHVQHEIRRPDGTMDPYDAEEYEDQARWVAANVPQGEPWAPLEPCSGTQKRDHSASTCAPPHDDRDAPPHPAHADCKEPGKSREGLPVIVTPNRPLRDVSAEALGVLEASNNPPALFVRSGSICRVRPDEHGRPIIEPVTEHMIRGYLTRCADFLGERDRHISPSNLVVRDILAAGSWPFPPLRAVVEVPVLRPNGTVLVEPGYDPETRLVYIPADGLTIPVIPDNPSQEDAIRAREILSEAVGEFPYTSAADYANTLGLLLTPIARPAINGPVPVAVIDSPSAGTGKGLLSAVGARLSTGREAALMSAVRDDEEWRKQITSALLSGATVITIDNVNGVLDSASLARAVTAETWSDRFLGTNSQAYLPQRATWVVNGNNVALGGDIPRRCYRIRLDAQVSNPWLDREFTHPRLLEWVGQHRGELLGAALTMARAWFVAGCPEANTPEVGTFECWSKVVGGILAFAGVEDFLGNLEEVYEEMDADSPQWEGFLAALRDRFGDQIVTARQIADHVYESDSLRQSLPDKLLAALGKSSLAFVLALGQELVSQAEVRYGHLRIVRAGKDGHTKRPFWQVVDGRSHSNSEHTQSTQSLAKKTEPKSWTPANLGTVRGSAGVCTPRPHADAGVSIHCTDIELGARNPRRPPQPPQVVPVAATIAAQTPANAERADPLAADDGETVDVFADD